MLLVDRFFPMNHLLNSFLDVYAWLNPFQSNIRIVLSSLEKNIPIVRRLEALII